MPFRLETHHLPELLVIIKEHLNFYYMNLFLEKCYIFSGVSSMSLDSTRSRLFVGCMDSVVYEFNCASFTKSPGSSRIFCLLQQLNDVHVHDMYVAVRKYKGHQTASFYVKTSLSPDDNFLVSGSSDSQVYIWPLNSENATPVQLIGVSLFSNILTCFN